MRVPTAARSMPDGSEDAGRVLLKGLGGAAYGAQDALGAVPDAPAVVVDQKGEGVQHERIHGEVAGLRVGLARAAPAQRLLLRWRGPRPPAGALLKDSTVKQGVQEVHPRLLKGLGQDPDRYSGWDPLRLALHGRGSRCCILPHLYGSEVCKA